MIVQNEMIFSEVFSILNLLGAEYIEKLPNDLINLIKKEKDNDYNPSYVLNLPFDKQNISKESLAMITLFNLNYWCKTDEDKELIKKNISKNDKILEDKYSHKKLFEQNKVNFKNSQNIKSNSDMKLVQYKEPFITRIFNKILGLLKK